MLRDHRFVITPRNYIFIMLDDGNDIRMFQYKNCNMRIAKFIAKAGFCSRREAERLISAGRISCNNKVVTTPVTFVDHMKDIVSIDGVPLADLYSSQHASKLFYSHSDAKTNVKAIIYNTEKGTKQNLIQQPRIWLFHKPLDTITSYYDPQGRTTIFSLLHGGLPRLMAVGRLDYKTEGLLLLSNSGELVRSLELPQNALVRTYRCYYTGTLTEENIEKAYLGVNVNGVQYRSVVIKRDREKNKNRNSWITISLTEGKNREIRCILHSFNLHIIRLIRISFGNFNLGILQAGNIQEATHQQVSAYL